MLYSQFSEAIHFPPTKFNEDIPLWSELLNLFNWPGRNIALSRTECDLRTRGKRSVVVGFIFAFLMHKSSSLLEEWSLGKDLDQGVIGEKRPCKVLRSRGLKVISGYRPAELRLCKGFLHWYCWDPAVMRDTRSGSGLWPVGESLCLADNGRTGAVDSIM